MLACFTCVRACLSVCDVGIYVCLRMYVRA